MSVWCQTSDESLETGSDDVQPNVERQFVVAEKHLSMVRTFQCQEDHVAERIITNAQIPRVNVLAIVCIAKPQVAKIVLGVDGVKAMQNSCSFMSISHEGDGAILRHLPISPRNPVSVAYRKLGI